MNSIPILLLAILALPLSAQTTVIAGTGCKDGVGVGDPIEPTEAMPKLGSLTYALAHTCPFGSNGAFIVWGTCSTGPLVNWSLTSPCFAAWTSVPATCARVDGNLQPLAGVLTRQSKMRWPFAIPNIPGLLTLPPFCFQVICVDMLAVPGSCLSVSAGLQLVLVPAGC